MLNQMELQTLNFLEVGEKNCISMSCIDSWVWRLAFTFHHINSDKWNLLLKFFMRRKRWVFFYFFFSFEYSYQVLKNKEVIVKRISQFKGLHIANLLEFLISDWKGIDNLASKYNIKNICSDWLINLCKSNFKYI